MKTPDLKPVVSEAITPISRYAREKFKPTKNPSSPSLINRRTFLKAAAAAGAVMPLLPHLPGTAEGQSVAAEPNNDFTIAPLPKSKGDSGIGIKVEADEGHELILQALAFNGVDCLFFCGGTDNFVFMEGVKKFEELGRPHPKLIQCLHESVALSAAHGHFMVSGKPQAVVVHVDLGTQNVGGAIHNAWVGNAGIIFMAGRTPYTTMGELRGSRNNAIHFIQETYDQAEIVRQYTKWDYELKTTKNIGLVMQRAFRIATSEPWGPVYLTLPREILMESIDGGIVHSPENFAAAISPQGDTKALQKAAELLVKAERPVVLVKRMGRHPEAVLALTELAELLSLPVLSDNVFLNFPVNHHLSANPNDSKNYIENADVILMIDNDVPYTPASYSPPEGCKIISMDIDPVRLAQPLWGFPVHIPITCDSSKTIPVLTELAKGRLQESEKQVIKNRKDKMMVQHKASLAAMAARVDEASKQMPISPEWLGHCVNEVVDNNTIVIAGLARGITPAASAQPGSYFGIPGSSLGWAVPAGLGAKLAAPHKTIITACGDGDFVFADPTACLWQARRYGTPTLTIIINNKEYKAVGDQVRYYYPEGYVVSSNDFNGSSLEPSPEYAMVARACGAYGETISNPALLPRALERGLSAVHSGQAAVLDVHVA